MHQKTVATDVEQVSAPHARLVGATQLDWRKYNPPADAADILAACLMSLLPVQLPNWLIWPVAARRATPMRYGLTHRVLEMFSKQPSCGYVMESRPTI